MNLTHDLALARQMRPQMEPREINTLGAALEVSADLSADQAAGASSLAAALGLPEEVVLAAPREAERAALYKRATAHPGAAGWAGPGALGGGL